MRRTFSAAVAAVLALALLAGPAVANDTGTGEGGAAVGKNKYGAGCSSNPTGGGLGFAGLGANGKKAYYRILGTITSLTKGTGSFVACGQLDPDPVTGIGAACGASSSNNGHGWFNYANGINKVQLTDVGWDASATAFVVTGNAYDHGKDGKNGALVAIAQADGGRDCAFKGADKATAPGATTFNVTFAYTITNVKDPMMKHTKPKGPDKPPKYTDPKA